MTEKFLTLPRPAFDTLLRKNPVTETPVGNERPEAYRYSKVRALDNLSSRLSDQYRVVFKVHHEVAA